MRDEQIRELVALIESLPEEDQELISDSLDVLEAMQEMRAAE